MCVSFFYRAVASKPSPTAIVASGRKALGNKQASHSRRAIGGNDRFGASGIRALRHCSACIHLAAPERCTALRARLLYTHCSIARRRGTAEAVRTHRAHDAGALPDRAKLRARPNETLRDARTARPLRRVRLGRTDAGLEYSTTQRGPPLLERRRVLRIFCGRSCTARATIVRFRKWCRLRGPHNFVEVVARSHVNVRRGPVLVARLVSTDDRKKRA